MIVHRVRTYVSNRRVLSVCAERDHNKDGLLWVHINKYERTTYNGVQIYENTYMMRVINRYVRTQPKRTTGIGPRHFKDLGAKCLYYFVLSFRVEQPEFISRFFF